MVVIIAVEKKKEEQKKLQFKLEDIQGGPNGTNVSRLIKNMIHTRTHTLLCVLRSIFFLLLFAEVH